MCIVSLVKREAMPYSRTQLFQKRYNKSTKGSHYQSFQFVLLHNLSRVYISLKRGLDKRGSDVDLFGMYPKPIICLHSLVLLLNLAYLVATCCKRENIFNLNFSITQLHSEFNQALPPL